MLLAFASPVRLLVLLLALTHAATASDKPLIIENGAVCENKATGFFVVDNTILSTTDSIVYKDTPEEDCLTTCSTNRDRFGRSILCASFVYDHASFTCTIFKEKAKPEGKAEVLQAVGKRYFEKVCLGGDVPMECADSQFIRADDSVLIGFARNVTLVETMEQCVEQCVKENDCKSAMYFYEEGECITNTESALTKPSAFAKEENEKVVYFQNGCLAKIRVQQETTTASAQSTADTDTESSEMTDEAEPPAEKELATLTTTEPLENSGGRTDKDQVGGSGKEDTAAEEPDSVETSTDSQASTAVLPSSTTHEKAGEDEEVEETTSAETTPVAIEVTTSEIEQGMKTDDEDEEYAADGENDDDVETATDKSMEKLSKKGEKASYIKYKKHPKNFASKTAKLTKKELSVKAATERTTEENFEDQAVAGSSSGEEEAVGESVVSDVDGEPIEGQTSPLEGKKHLSIKRVLENTGTEGTEDFPTYFSDWSDWTPCTKAGERQIRRRKCLDLRRCLGALMQVRNCPAVLPEPVQESGPIESVRSVMEVPRIPEYDDADVTHTNPRQASASQPPSDSVWSPWLGVCQHFASGQPCNNGEMIGFESRECVAKEPSLCEGPFFRYCTLAC